MSSCFGGLSHRVWIGSTGAFSSRVFFDELGWFSSCLVQSTPQILSCFLSGFFLRSLLLTRQHLAECANQNSSPIDGCTIVQSWGAPVAHTIFCEACRDCGEAIYGVPTTPDSLLPHLRAPVWGSQVPALEHIAFVRIAWLGTESLSWVPCGTPFLVNNTGFQSCHFDSVSKLLQGPCGQVSSVGGSYSSPALLKIGRHLNMMPKTQATEEKIDKLCFIEIKNLCVSKKAQQSEKTAHGIEETSASHVQ